MSGGTQHKLGWLVLICGLLCTVGFGLASIWLFVLAIDGNHSHSGRILVLGAAMLSLLVSIFFFSFGVLYWKTTKIEPDAGTNA